MQKAHLVLILADAVCRLKKAKTCDRCLSNTACNLCNNPVSSLLTPLYSGENGSFLHLAQATQLESRSLGFSFCLTGPWTCSCLPFPLRPAAMLKRTTRGRQNHTGDVLPPSRLPVPSHSSPKARDDPSHCELGRSHSGRSERGGAGSQTHLENPPLLPQPCQSGGPTPTACGDGLAAWR